MRYQFTGDLVSVALLWKYIDLGEEARGTYDGLEFWPGALETHPVVFK